MVVGRGSEAPGSRLTRIGSALYRTTLRLVPGWLRGRLDAQMLDVFEQRQREAAARSTLRLVRLWGAELGPLVVLAGRARWRGRRVLMLGDAPLPEQRLSPTSNTPPHRVPGPGDAHFMDSLALDLRFALRTLAKSPVFTTVAILTIAVGIGINTALFGIVNVVLLRPLPVADPDRLIEIRTTENDPPGPQGYSAMSLADLRDYDELAEALTGIAGHSLFFTGLTEGNASRVILGEIVTGNYFEVLGAPILAGRALTRNDDMVAGAHAVTVISHDFWRAHFDGAADALGRTVRLAGIPYEIVGIAAPEFTGAFASVSTRLWIPTMMSEQVEPAGTNDETPSPGATRLERRGYRWLSVKGRLADGVSIEQARAELQSIGEGIAARFPDINAERRPVALEPGSLRVHPSLDAAFSSVVGFLFAIVGLVLLVACANVANMLLARASVRAREVAIRAALGAGLGRIVRQMVTESVLLGLGGGLVGLALGAWMTGVLTRVALPLPVELPLDFDFDTRVFAFALATSLLSGLTFGVVPALRASSADLVSALRASGGSTGTGSSYLQRGLLVAQVAMSLTLLIGAAFFVTTAAVAGDVDLGIDGDRIVVLTFALEMSGYTDAEAIAFYPRVLPRLAALPGVEAASFATGLPLSLNIHSTVVLPEGVEPRDNGRGYTTARTLTGPGYFETTGVRTLRGRVFDERDSQESQPVTVVNEAFARRYWPGEDPLGKTVRSGSRDWTVVGVVSDHKVTSPVGPVDPFIHFPWEQARSPFASLLVRTSGSARVRVAEIQRELLAEEPGLVFVGADTFAGMASVLTLPLRLAAGLLVAFACVAALLASIGLYGAVAQSVARRTRELGVRKALGAGRLRIVQQVARGSLGVAVVGVIAGLVLANLGARAFAGFLYGVSPDSAMPYLAGLSALAILLGLSHLVPARRAAQVDPMVALREQ